MRNTYYVYILTNRKNGVLYTGITNDLLRRVYEHKKGITKGFTARYNTTKLVYFETTDSAYSAIKREKCIKKWYRKWKIELIESFNPEWEDLYYKYGGFDEYENRYPLARV